MGIENISLIIVAIGTFVLSFFIYIRDRKNEINISFGLLTFCGAIWAFNVVMFRISTRIESVWFWDRMIYAFGSVFACSFLYFSMVFPFRKTVLSAIWKFLIFSPLIIFLSFLLFTNLFIQDINIVPQGNEVNLGPAYIVWILWFFIFMSWSFINLLLKYRKSTGISKMQIRYVLLAFLFPVVTSTPFNLILPYFGNYKLIWVGPLFLAPLFIIISFAVTKYHLFEIKVILTELLVVAMGVILLILPFLMNTFHLRTLTIGIFLLFCIFGYFLVRATHREAKRREEAEKIAIRERTLRERSEKLAKEIKRLDDAKTQFLMATQHHLRTPLTSMRGYLDLIFEGSYGKVPQKLNQTLHKFQTSTNRLNRIVSELLDISQFQLGKEIVSLQPNIQIESILREIIEELRFEVAQKHIYLKLIEPKTKIPSIKADSQKLKVALTNIIDNAVKYTDKGGVTINIKYEQVPRKREQKSNIRNESKLQIMVKDTGMGISKEELNTLFTRIFERSKEAKKVYTTGKGIGLYITSKIIEAHKGDIWAESEGKGKGSSFYVELLVDK